MPGCNVKIIECKRYLSLHTDGHLTLNMGLFLSKKMKTKQKHFTVARHLYIKSVYNYLRLRESEMREATNNNQC